MECFTALHDRHQVGLSMRRTALDNEGAASLSLSLLNPGKPFSYLVHVDASDDDVGRLVAGRLVRLYLSTTSIST
ncbi:hypothetical protein LX36DRAFT_101565 [Colletotrichum falcatum]|nr:hypothetical protein LX36DRAFT_101565 [Colletotrichum falcatum]